MKKPTLLLLALCVALLCHSQSGLYVSGTTTLSIRSNTTLAVDGLVLTPSSDYVVTGTNHVTRAPTLLHPSITPAIHRSFQWATSLPPFTGDIGIYYEDAELNGLAEAELTLNVHNGTQWQAFPGGVSRNTVTNLVTTPVSGLLPQELTLAAEAHPLPLQWGQIAATRKEKSALVEWQTFNEVQTAFFEVERSADGQHWSRTGHAVMARNQPGTHYYQFIDSSVSNNKTFYRIKQVDRDGRASFSAIAWIPALLQPAGVSIYPNPASQQLSIYSTALPLHTLRLFDANGKLLQTESVPNVFNHTIAIASLPKGIYVMQVQLTDGSITHLSFIKH